MAQYKKNIILLLVGIFVGGVFAGPVVNAAVEKITGQRSEQEIYVDGQRVEMEAYIIHDNNYVKLRDIGKALDFNVYWDGTVQMNSDRPYTGEAPVSQERSQLDQPGITKEEAREIALRDAGIGEQDVTSLSVEIDRENSVPVYEVEFRSGTTKYEIDVSIATGEIVDRSQETKPVPIPAPSEPVRNDFDEEKAINAALTHAGLTRDNVTGLKIEKDRENNLEVYEVEFSQGYTEYSYDIDVATLEIIKWEKDVD